MFAIEKILCPIENKTLIRIIFFGGCSILCGFKQEDSSCFGKDPLSAGEVNGCSSWPMVS